jgi:integrase
MQRIRKDKLTLYRRHNRSCTQRNLNCNCPLWVHGRLKGEFVRLPLGTRSLIDGEIKRKQMENPQPEGPGGGGGIRLAGSAPVTLAAASAAFLAAKQDKKRGTNTMAAYRSVIDELRAFAERSGVTLLSEVTTLLIEQFFAAHPEWKHRTRAAYLTRIRIFFNYCTPRWIGYSPAADKSLSFGKAKDLAHLPYTPEEVDRILSAVERLKPGERERGRALVLLLLYSGMRISDATFIERSFIRERNLLDYIVIKNRRWIDQPIELHPSALDALLALPLTRTYFFQEDRDGDYSEARAALRRAEEFGAVMPQYSTRIERTSDLVMRVLKLAGVQGTCHQFRDTFAINFLVHGGDIFVLSKCLGHTDVRITQDHYVKLVKGYRDRMASCTRVLDYQLKLSLAG